MDIYQVSQQLVSRPLADVRSAVMQELTSRGLRVPKGRIAITVGSRGICNLPVIIRACGDWLKEQGASPFIVPAMGSHNGATAEGQRKMVESLGVTESAMEMPICSSMEVVEVGKVRTGSVYMDRFCYEADGVLVVNRVKLHTCFSGPVQSGLTKMMVVGMGKIRSAQTFHSSRPAAMKDMLLEMGQSILDSGRIVGGLAILEDGFDQTAELHALRPEEILKREAELLAHHRSYFPRLPVDDLNVLIVESIGKTYSGTGMDTNVIGRRGIREFEDLTSPRIRAIGALSLSTASQGNAIGVGLADFITRRLRNDIDEYKTMVNTLTTADMDRAKIPVTLADDTTLIDIIAGRYGTSRWMFIPNTLHLGQLYVTEDLCEELSRHPQCKVSRTPVTLSFQDGRCQLNWSDLSHG
ncbi:MAG: lactate racemase domain-containing protein [Planctomyces sp.]